MIENTGAHRCAPLLRVRLLEIFSADYERENQAILLSETNQGVVIWVTIKWSSQV